LDHPEWSEEEQRLIFDEIDNFGIERDVNGDPDCRQLRRIIGLTEKSLESVKDYVLMIVNEMQNNSELSLEIRIRFRIDIDGMDRLRWIATGRNESDFGRFLQRAKTLTIPGAEWNLVLERQLFGEMEWISSF
jgi:hypothetical protein